VDTVLMYYLLKAIPRNATFVLVGDVNQLPSVGAGNVLKDIIHSGSVPVAGLDRIFRQARESQIIVSAHEINRGVIPPFSSNHPNNDCYFIVQEAPEEVLRIIIELVMTRIPNKFGFDPLDDIQVLTPMHKGLVGSGNLNAELQKALNSGNLGIERGNRVYRENDKVMQIRNNYDKEVFNGDIGRISKINFDDQILQITFEGRIVDYEFSDLDEIVLAYAVSVHKSQGSEYPVVIIPVLTQHYILLQRNLIYTGITRGRQLVIFVGTKKALAIAVKNDKTQKRYTHLNFRLRVRK
jgi:exodeoxyribonuclease V alpha subunit